MLGLFHRCSTYRVLLWYAPMTCHLSSQYPTKKADRVIFQRRHCRPALLIISFPAFVIQNRFPFSNDVKKKVIGNLSSVRSRTNYCWLSDDNSIFVLQSIVLSHYFWLSLSFFYLSLTSRMYLLRWNLIIHTIEYQIIKVYILFTYT